ncbi:MAG: hypothetical protein LLF95_09235 [Bacteroidales bacterium]|nr:hypothetical protein [Bacteroidales bacterium]
MKKTIIFSFGLCFLCTIFSFDLSAQEYKNFDLSKYYTPDIVRNAMDLNFNSAGQYSNSKGRYEDPAWTVDSSSTSNINGTINSSFNTYKNTRKRISSLTLNGYFSGAYSSNRETTGSTDKRNSNAGSLGVNYSDKFYSTSTFFLSAGIIAWLNPRNYRQNEEMRLYQKKTNGKNIGYTFNPSVGIGIGRIEQVQDARQAIYMLNDLSKKGVLTRQLTDNEVFSLAQQMSTVKNKRFLDSRLRLIDEVTAIDAFFVSNGLLNKSDAAYFTTLYDNWLYGAAFERKSGQTFEFQINGSIRNDYSKTETNFTLPDSVYWSKSNSNQVRGELALVYAFEKPFKLNWQHSANASLRASLIPVEHKNSNSTSDTENISSYDNRDISLWGNYKLGYYPNSRTNLQLGISQSVGRSFQKNTTANVDEEQIKNFNAQTVLDFSTYYYLSPQLRISGTVSAVKNYYKNNYIVSILKGNNFNAHFNLTLNYAFF